MVAMALMLPLLPSARMRSESRSLISAVLP
jgi:hypothetical protein